LLRGRLARLMARSVKGMQRGLDESPIDERFHVLALCLIAKGKGKIALGGCVGCSWGSSGCFWSGYLRQRSTLSYEIERLFLFVHGKIRK
jgi:hypothetical protein